MLHKAILTVTRTVATFFVAPYNIASLTTKTIPTMGLAHCGNCFGREDCNVVVCDGEGCDRSGYCQDCLVKDWEEDTWDCNDCRERFREGASAIMSRQHLEIESLRQEIDRLRLENEELRDRDGSSSSSA